MWSDWLVFCDCGFLSVCPLMEKDKRLMEASWWERLTKGKLGLVLTSTSALMTMPKPLTVWTTRNSGKFFKRWEYQTTLHASGEIYIQVKKHQLDQTWNNWSSNTLATWCEELTHWKRPWWWERLKAGEGDNCGWDGWMASLTWWTWVWASTRIWWWAR